MKNIRKTLNLIALTVFMGSNLLTPISYAVDDLEFEVETPQLKSDSIIQVVPNISEGGGESLTNLENGAEEKNSSLDAPDGEKNDNIQEGDIQEDKDKKETVEDSTDEKAKTDGNNTVLDPSLTFHGEEDPTPSSPFLEGEEYGLEQNSQEKTAGNSATEQAKTSTDNTVLDHFFHSEEGDNLTPSSPFQGDGKENLEQTAKEGESSPVVSDNDGDDTDEEEGDEDEDPLPEDERKKELEKARETLEGPITESETFDELGMVVKVKALSGTFPKGTYPEITLIQGTEKEKVEQQIIDSENANVSEDAEMITFDIKFIYTLSNGSGVEVQPKDNTVQVTFEYKDNEELQQAEESPEQDIQIIHINDKDENGEKVAEGEEKVETIDINEQKSVKVENGLVIDAESFSYYTIVVQIREEAPDTQTWQYGTGKDYLTISIAKPSSITESGLPEGFTIMDRNLGATATGYATTQSSAINGYKYQWGNNYGFSDSTTVSAVTTGLPWDESYNHNGYVSKSFINGSSHDYDVWDGNNPTANDKEHHDGIWGGENDNADNWRGAKLTNYAERQGPCPEGWHVPSAGEWGLLIRYWAETDNNATYGGDKGLYYLNSNHGAFQQKFNLPFAGYRGSSDATLNNQGSYGYYWSSSPYGSDNPNYARRLSLGSSDVNASSNHYRARGYSVRCFKDSYVASPDTSNLTDTQAWVEGKDFETITISNPDDITQGFTIMDRNLGAENAVVSTTAGTIANTGSYGFKYQWGNNYGFVDGCWTNGCSDPNTSSAITTLATWNENGIYNNHGYFGNKFIKGSSDYWQSSLHYDNLRGGAGDVNFASSPNSVNGLYWDDGGDRSLRQGPCPVGYHVPSAGEWSMLVYYWYKKNYNATPSISNNLYYFSNTTRRKAFMTFFKLPFAGARDYSDATLYSQGSNGNYWSSSPYSAGSNIARILYLYSSDVNAYHRYNRASGYSVRCFKDSYVAPKTYTLTFDSQGGTAVSGQTVVEGQTRSRPATNPTKTNWTFDNWYTSTGYTSVFDFSTPASANTTVYAKWNDAVAPANVTISTTSNEKATSQTATLSCTDEIGVTKYYWGTSSSPADSVYTTVTSTTSFSTTQSVSSAGTYYLFCKDAAGNTSTSATKTYYTYSVQNMLDKVSGTQGTYNTTNYETNGSSMGTYIIPSGTSITLNNSTSYGDPMSSHDTYAGYTTANSGTPTNSNPTISANTTYYRWFNRDSHTLTLNKGTGVSSVSGAGTHKHGASVSISATPNTSAGYSFTSWTVNNGNNPANTSNASTTVTITQNTTLTANASDTTAPTIEINTQPSTSCAISKTVKATITDGVGVDTRQYAIISSSTCNSSIASTATWNSYTNESNITLDNENLNDKYICFRASDEAGNTSYLATNQITNIDTAGPGTPSLSLPADNTYTNNNKPTLTWTAGSIAGCSTLANYEIQICSDSSCNTVEQSNTSATNATWTPTTALNDGTYYWRVREKDSLNRYSDYTSTKSFIVDTTAPTAPTCTANACYKGSKAVTCTSAETPIRYTTDGSAPTCSSSTWTNQSFSATTTLKVAVCDPAGNLSDVNTYTYTADNSAPSVPTMTAEPQYTQGLSNAVTSSTVTDNGCNGNVQYQFCKSTTNSTTNCSDTNLSNWLDTAGTTFTNLTDGQKYYYFVRTKDGLGNTSEWSESVSSTQDNSAPAITFTNNVKQNPSKVDDVSVDWKDATVRKWKYSDTDSCPTTSSSYDKTESDTMNQSDETNNGKYICLYAEDALGNATQLPSAYPINIDITAPTGGAFNINDNAQYTNSTAVTLKTTCATDTGAGAVEVAYGNTTNPDNWTDCSSEIDWTLTSGDGEKTVYMKFKDRLGNESAEITDTIILDTTAPALSANNAGEWKTSDITITLSVDDTNGINYSKYSWVSLADCVSNGTEFDNADTLSYTTEGQSTLYLCARDNAGNTKTWTGIYKLDTVAPAVSFSSENGAVAKSHTVTVTVTDSTSKIGADQKIKYKWSESAECGTEGFTQLSLTPSEAGSTTATAQVSTSGLSDGSYYLCILGGTVSDIAGNTNSSNKTDGVFVIDNTPPVFSEKTEFSNGWYTGNQISTFTYTDTGAGIADGENTTSCTISTEGEDSACTIEHVNICDKLGNCNTESQTSDSIKLDKTAPTFKEKTEFTNGWYNTNQESEFIYEDNISGISGSNKTTCIIDEEGEDAKCTVVTTNICNNAGLCNTINLTSNSIKLDKTNPTCEITGNPVSPVKQDITLTVNYKVEANQIDNGYSWDGLTYSSTKTHTVSTNGTYTAYVKDEAGNTGSCNITVSMIDKTNPTATITSTNNLKQTTQTASLSCSDNEGIASYYRGTKSNPENSDFTAVGTPSTSFSTDKTVNNNGTYYLFCKDTAGNISDSVSKTYYSYEVHNMLNAIAQAEGTYNSTNYPQASTDTYIALSGTEIPFSNVYTAPTYSDPYQYVGYTTTDSGTPSHSDSIYLNGNSVYYFWFNRVNHALILQIDTGIENIHYKVNNASDYTMVSDTTEVSMKEGSNAYAYATASDGYELTGIFKDYDADNPKSWNTITAQQIFIPETDIITYSIDYELNGGELEAGKSNPEEYTVETPTFTLNNPVKDGYTFAGWTGTALSDATETVTIEKGGFGNREYTATYSINSYNYSVEYYYDGSIDNAKTVTGKAEFDSQITSYPNKVIDGYKFDHDTGKPLTITSNSGNNVIKVYYVKDNFEYSVEYYYDGVKDDAKTVTGKAEFDSQISTYMDKVIDGYVLSGTVGLPLTITSNSGNNVIRVYYVKDNFDYSVEYYYDGVKDDAKTVTGKAEFDSQISTYTDKVIDGYVLSGTVGLPLTITSTVENNVIKVYYKKSTSLSYTIKYEDADHNMLSGDVVVPNQTFGDVITVTPGAIEGYVTPSAKNVTITANSSANVVTFTYNKRTDLTYTVTYKDKYGSGLLADKTVNTGVMNTDVTENAPSIEGYEVQTGSFTIRLKATNNHIDFVYNPKEYTIKFVDGSGVEITETYSGEYLSDISLIDYPNWTKDGYTIHWDKAVPEKMPLYGIVITATWTPNTNTQYLVYHKKEKLDGTYETIDIYTGYGTTDTKVTPTVNSYPGFNSPEPQEITISGNGNTTLIYQYSRKIITLTLNNDNGSQNTIITGKYESDVQKPTTNPSKTGYTFTAWSPVIPDTFPAISGTHTAQWNVVTYGITYHLNGGTQVNPKEIYTIESDSFTLVNPTRDNYIFAGWTGSNGDELQTTVTIAKGTTGPKEYFANWYEDFNHNGQNDATETKYTVKFVAGEHGTLGGTTTYSGILSGYTLNDVVGYTEPSKNPATNYIFSGWTPSLNVNAKITSNVVYTGIFAEDFNHNGINDVTEPHFTVRYTDGVDGQVVFADQVTSNILSGLATPSFNGSTGRDNYIFAGWTPSVVDKVTGDATYTASWYEDFNHDGQNDATETKIVVRFLPGEHGSLAGTTVYEVLSGLTLASAGYTTAPTVTPDSDYMFSGWNAEIDTVNPLTSNVDYTAIYGEDKNHDGQNDEFETKYTVTINYVYSRGGTATGSYTTGNQLSGFTYNVDSPVITNYHADKITISGTITRNVSVTVTYSPNTDTNHNEIADEEETPYKVTVNYEYSRGGKASPSVSGMYLSGIVFNFVSPNVPNYTPNSGTVSGTGIEADQTFTVIYRPNTDENNDGYADEEETHYTLTIHYINTHSGTVFTDYTASLVSGASYNVVSQTKNHYTVSPVTVSGVMSNENVEVYVIYTPDNDTNNNGIADEEENITPSNSSSNSSGGGGRRIVTPTTHGVSDAENDTKDQQSINEENNKNQNNPVGNKDSELIITDKNTKNYSSEVIDAYKWAYANDITTINSLDKAKPDNAIIRGHMAKVVVNYAVNVLGKEMPKEIPSYCKWNDNVKDWESKEIKEYAEKACALGIMGINVKSFQPKKVVTRAEFGTILSRILRGDKYNETKASKQNPYYAKHLKALKENGIMTKIDNPLNRKELREWVWVMLKRTAEM